jgi:methionyl-tRNA formyltransferase
LEEKDSMMKKEDFRIVFMGTPEFAVCILDKLVQDNYSIVGVITAPDKPAGRGQQVHQSDVKKYAIEKQLNILQPTNLKDETFIHQLKDLRADLFVVVAFRMLPEVVWAMPPKGTINLHASLLPNYRGAAPINWAVINGDKETGVTSFFIEKEIDTGKIIERSKLLIGENETVGELHDRLMNLGAEVIESTVQKIIKGEAIGIEQLKLAEGELKIAPKIFKQDCKIDWNQNIDIVHNFIRGLSPYPAAWCSLKNKIKGDEKSFKIFLSEKTNTPSNGQSSLKKEIDGIYFPCKDYYLKITEIQMEGKRRMHFKEFLAGNTVSDWEIID